MNEVCTTPVTGTSTLTEMLLRDAEATFADGSTVHIQEADLEHAITKDAFETLGCDTEHQYVLVGIGWSRIDRGLVVLPDELLSEAGSEGEEVRRWDYDRLAHIDRAIATLERAKAALEASR